MPPRRRGGTPSKKRLQLPGQLPCTSLHERQSPKHAEPISRGGKEGKYHMNRPILAALIIACGLSWLSVDKAACANTLDVPQLNQADLETWLDGFVPSALQKGEIAGAVVLVLKDGNV